MGNRFHFSLVKHQRCFDQRFTISGRTGIDDLCRGGKMFIDFLNGPDRGFQRASVIVVIERIKERAVLTHQSCLGGGGACVDSQKAVSFIGFQISGDYVILLLTSGKCVIILPGREKRLHTCYFKFHLNGRGELRDHIGKRNGTCLLMVQCRTNRSKKMRIFRSNRMFSIQFQGADKSRFKL